MRRGRPLVLAGGIGAALGAILVVVAVLESPVVIAPANSVIVIPADLNTTAQDGGVNHCSQQGGCGFAGSTDLWFNLSRSSALTGTLSSSGPMTLLLAIGGDLGTVQCGLRYPPTNCTPAYGSVGPWTLVSEGAGVSEVDLSRLQFDVSGAHNVVPAGEWTLVLVNWSLSVETVTVGQAVEATPTS
ncbi:MAG: hypothetical protein L3K03_06105 [Thermoplasmata archaeon]|nr:hypothetical protein [Thermoplasmata archaeon]